jgi:hypothetical protein
MNSRIFASAALLPFAFVAALSGAARATPEYPLVLDAAFGTSCPNPNSRCVICHTSARGGQATAVRAFAETLGDFGLNRGRDPALLQSALARLPPETDSDDDGSPDIEELMTCGNPSGENLGAGPEYGCDGARLAPAPRAHDDGALALAALLVGFALVRRRPTLVR